MLEHAKMRSVTQWNSKKMSTLFEGLGDGPFRGLEGH